MAYPSNAASKRAIHPSSVRPYSSSPLASKPGNIATGGFSVKRIGPKGANQPAILGGKR